MREPVHRLFFALLPDAETRAAITAAARRANEAGGFRGTGVAASRYHMTIQFLGDFPVAPHAEIERAKDAAANLKSDPFDFALDRIMSFHGGRFPCVLLASAATAPALRMFWQRLYFALIRAGFSNKLERRFASHVTLGYGDTPLVDAIVIAPIAWHAQEFALIESLVGQSIHNTVASWRIGT
jgi:2'-5' RNA ligase